MNKASILTIAMVPAFCSNAVGMQEQPEPLTFINTVQYGFPQAMSPDGKIIAHNSLKRIALYAAHSGNEITACSFPSRKINLVTFSADGTQCAITCHDDSIIHLLPMKKGDFHKRIVFNGNIPSAGALAFSPQGSTFAYLKTFDSINYWHFLPHPPEDGLSSDDDFLSKEDLQFYRLPHYCHLPNDAVHRHLLFVDEDTCVCSAKQDSQNTLLLCQLTEPPTPDHIKKKCFLGGFADLVDLVNAHEQPHIVAAATKDDIFLWNTQTEPPTEPLIKKCSPRAIALAPDARHLVTKSNGHSSLDVYALDITSTAATLVWRQQLTPAVPKGVYPLTIRPRLWWTINNVVAYRDEHGTVTRLQSPIEKEKNEPITHRATCIMHVNIRHARSARTTRSAYTTKQILDLWKRTSSQRK